MEKQEGIVKHLAKALSDFKKSPHKGYSEEITAVNDHYNKMVKDGLIKKKEYNLRGINDDHILRAKFNS